MWHRNTSRVMAEKFMQDETWSSLSASWTSLFGPSSHFSLRITTQQRLGPRLSETYPLLPSRDSCCRWRSTSGSTLLFSPSYWRKTTLTKTRLTAPKKNLNWDNQIGSYRDLLVFVHGLLKLVPSLVWLSRRNPPNHVPRLQLISAFVNRKPNT